MNSHLQFDFTVDKANNSVNVKREFAAELALVWAAWTQAELLDIWWAPKPFQTKTKSMDFKVGGTWLYAMHGPNNQTHWCRADYLKIEHQKMYSAIDAFCDEDGNMNLDFPRSTWSNTFIDKGESTLVDISIQYQSLADLEKIVELGFKEGFTMALGNLDQYIEAKFKLRTELRTNNQARVCTYLNFPGNTEEAMYFYKQIFKTEFLGNGIQHFGDLPADESQPPMPDAIKKMVLHVELPTIGNHVLMATDAPKEMGFTLNQGNNMHISLEPETREETERLFNELAAGGTITMPLEDMFFGSYYGSLTDRYGINWMVNFVNPK